MRVRRWPDVLNLSNRLALNVSVGVEMDGKPRVALTHGGGGGAVGDFAGAGDTLRRLVGGGRTEGTR